ncbi:MAG: ATP:cob(I)alamin adenosyltransferase, partial [Pseudomonadales bacterium]
LIAQCHIARSTCRRAERSLIALAASEAINSAGLQFLNRFSDYLFVLGRAIARASATGEVLWEKDQLA